MAWTLPYGDPDDLAVKYLVTSAISAFMLSPLVTVFGNPLWSLAPTGAFVAFAQLAIWRIMLVGLYVNEHGVKVRTVLRTQVIPWPFIDAVRVGPSRFLGYPAIWINARYPDRAVETPICCRQLGRSNGRRVQLDPEEFDELVVYLSGEAARLR